MSGLRLGCVTIYYKVLFWTVTCLLDLAYSSIDVMLSSIRLRLRCGLPVFRKVQELAYRRALEEPRPTERALLGFGRTHESVLSYPYTIPPRSTVRHSIVFGVDNTMVNFVSTSVLPVWDSSQGRKNGFECASVIDVGNAFDVLQNKGFRSFHLDIIEDLPK